jgi:hypothetical protein
MDLSQIPIVDAHNHPFDPVKEDDDFRVYFNMSLWRPPAEAINDTILNHKMMRELGKTIGAPQGADQEQIADFRNKVYKKTLKLISRNFLGKRALTQCLLILVSLMKNSRVTV